jgi:hypothetical protein
MHILKRHLYHGPLNDKDQDKPALTIPFVAFLKVIIAHKKQQDKMQISQSAHLMEVIQLTRKTRKILLQTLHA